MGKIAPRMTRNQPFDEQVCPGATVGDIDHRALSNFVRAAYDEREFPLTAKTPAADILAHLHMLVDGTPTRAAVLLFGREPQRWVLGAEVHCMHFHGTKIKRPAPYSRVFQGSLFDQYTEAVHGVFSLIDCSVGDRTFSTQAPTTYEIPPEAIREAVFNAIVHRDYASPDAIRVSVFANRVEVWNPGKLLSPLTGQQLRRPHRSVLRNARVYEALSRVRYVEECGTGTQMMIRQCDEHPIAKPSFAQRAGGFTVTLWRKWLTERVLIGLGLSYRQRTAVLHARINHRITNWEYQQYFPVSKQTATRELEQMRTLGVLRQVESTDGDTHYVPVAKRPI